MQNEGPIERLIQIIISITFLLIGIFQNENVWQIIFILLAFIISFFAIIGFCPLYFFLGKNTANRKINYKKWQKSKNYNIINKK